MPKSERLFRTEGTTRIFSMKCYDRVLGDLSESANDMENSMSEVDVVDISEFSSGSNEIGRAIARKLDHAFVNSGFLLLRGHGVPEEVIRNFENDVVKFFALPHESKAKIASTLNDNRGYRGKGRTSLGRVSDANAPVDLIEQFRIGRFNLPDNEYYRRTRTTLYHENKWPADLPDMRKHAEDYYTEVEGLAGKIRKIMACALRVKEGYFEESFDKHTSNLIANFYENLAGRRVEGKFRISPHTDFGAFSILKPVTSNKGLQICTDGSTWHDVPYVPGTFIINIGDILARWTNNKWRSTLHRVVATDATEDRISIGFFLQPNDDAGISCIPTCIRDDAPGDGSSVTAGELVRGSLQRAFVQKG